MLTLQHSHSNTQYCRQPKWNPQNHAITNSDTRCDQQRVGVTSVKALLSDKWASNGWSWNSRTTLYHSRVTGAMTGSSVWSAKPSRLWLWSKQLQNKTSSRLIQENHRSVLDWVKKQSSSHRVDQTKWCSTECWPEPKLTHPKQRNCHGTTVNHNQVQPSWQQNQLSDAHLHQHQ